MKAKGKRSLQHRLDSEGPLVTMTTAPKLSPRDAAYLRKLGTYVDTSQVAGTDDGLLSHADAMELRASGVLVLAEEIHPSPGRRKR